MNSKRRSALAVAATAAIVVSLLAIGAPAAHAEIECSADITDYEGTAVLTLDPSIVSPGDTITVVGTGYPPSSSVPLLLDGIDIGTATTDADGTFSFDFVIPLDATALGAFSSVCGTFILTATATFQSVVVTTTTTAPAVTPLPTTGSSSGDVAQVGLGLIAGGGLLLLLSRSRRTADPVAV